MQKPFGKFPILEVKLQLIIPSSMLAVNFTFRSFSSGLTSVNSTLYYADSDKIGTLNSHGVSTSVLIDEGEGVQVPTDLPPLAFSYNASMFLLLLTA